MKVKGGRHHALSPLQRRQKAYDDMPDCAPGSTFPRKTRQSYTRPGSNNKHKQL